MTDGRTITLRLGTLLTIAGIAAGALGGYLLRRDIQTVNQTGVRAQLATLNGQVTSMANEIALARAYLGSLREWAIRVSATEGWPEPRPTGSFLPQRYEKAPRSLLFDNAYADERKPGEARPAP